LHALIATIPMSLDHNLEAQKALGSAAESGTVLASRIREMSEQGEAVSSCFAAGFRSTSVGSRQSLVVQRVVDGVLE
jgi:hypothetical protein